MNVLLKRKSDEIDSLQEELKEKNSTIKGFEVINQIQKFDLKTIKEISEKNLTKLAEFKLLEANLNLEENNQKKFIINLQKEIGRLEVKLEKTEEELEENKAKLKIMSENLKENLIKMEESAALKKELQFLKLDQQKRTDCFNEQERSSNGKISDLEKLLKGHKDSSTNDMQSQECYISDMQLNSQKIKEENWSLQKKIANYEHQLNLLKISNDKTFISRKRDSNEINALEKNNESKGIQIDNYPEIPDFSKDFPLLKDSKETQTFFFEYIDSEAQTTEYKLSETTSLSANLLVNLNRNSQIEEIFNKNKSFNSPTNSNYAINTNHYNSPLNAIQKNNTLANLLQNSSNSNYVYPAKITEDLFTKKENSKKNKIFNIEEKKKLEIKINQSLENSSEKIKSSRANTERLREFPVKSTQNIIRDHERHFSFTDKESSKNINIKNKEKVHEKQPSYDLNSKRKSEEFKMFSVTE